MINPTKLGIFFSEELIPYYKAKDKKPYLMQITEMISLHERYKSLPYQYFKSKLYSTGAPKDITQFIPPKLIAKLQSKLNDNRKSKYAYDKHAFRVHMESQGLPVIRELFCILPSGIIHDSDQNEITRSMAEKMLTEHGENVFVKPAKGAFGNGAFIHDISKPMDYLFEKSVDVLVQPIVKQHETLNELHPCSLNTIRIDTLLYDGRCCNNAAVLKIGIDGIVVDNLRAGSLVTGIDLKTGRLFPKAMQRAKFSWGGHTHHPNTDIAFASVTIPFWKDVIEMTHEAAKALPQLRTLGWDIAITPTGPLLVETNIHWGVNLMQDGWGGMGATRIGQLAMEFC